MPSRVPPCGLAVACGMPFFFVVDESYNWNKRYLRTTVVRLPDDPPPSLVLIATTMWSLIRGYRLPKTSGCVLQCSEMSELLSLTSIFYDQGLVPLLYFFVIGRLSFHIRMGPSPKIWSKCQPACPC